MHNPERNKTYQILSEEDVWTAMSSTGKDVNIADSFDAILDYYEVSREFDSSSDHKRFIGIKKSFRNFCDSLNDEQFDAFLEYFLRSNNQKRLFCFFENLNIRKQQDFLNKLLSIVCESDSVHRDVRKLRKKIFKPRVNAPTTVNDAIATTDHIHVDGDKIVTGGRYLNEIIRFLEENKEMVIPYIDGVLEKHSHGAGVIRSILSQLMKPFWDKVERVKRSVV